MKMEEEQGRNATWPTSPVHDEQLNRRSDSSRASRSDTMATESSTAADAEAAWSNKRARRAGRIGKGTMLLSMLAAAPTVMAATCIPLAGSTTCSAFNSASISVDNTLIGFFPFLSAVKDTASFDRELSSYVATAYVQTKYENLLGCGGIDLRNTSNLYARFTTTVICNAIVQNSKNPCSLTDTNSRPVCAESCAQQAESEANIIANSALCSNPSSQAAQLIRADFTNCALPANSLTGSCIEAILNEPENCGYGNNLIGLCSYCGSGGQNSTDTCCYNSKADSRCVGVALPTITASISLTTVTATASVTSVPSPSSTGKSSSLSTGAVVGITIGAIAGLALLIGLLILLIICFRRRRRGSQKGSVFNQPSPPRKPQTSTAYNPAAPGAAPAGYEVLPGGRIARMSALEGHSGESPPRSERAVATSSAAAAGYAAGRRKHHDQSSSDEFSHSPASDVRAGVLRPPPTGRRTGSLSSGSVLGDNDPHSPQSGSGGDMSSPLGVASQQSEQLPFFKDYYSQDEIHPGDKVATLWGYQPRAGDEFLLERGDMLKVVGIWDDGWATGVMLDERADEWDAKRSAQRDSGVSNGSGRRDSSPQATGDIKAFPLVCVCLPQHWKKTIEGDGSTETGSSGAPHATHA